MFRMVSASLLILAFSLSARAFGSAIDDARTLENEATQILRASSGAVADPKVYAEAVRKLEKAQALLDEAAKGNPPGIDSIQQEVSSALFWARKFSNVQVIDELQGKPAKPVDTAGAEAAFKRAEQFETEHSGNDYAIALRWFQFSSEFSGTDLALRGLARAREAQARYNTAEEAKKKASEPQTADGKLIDEGNALFQQKKFDEALAKFNEAKKVVDSTVVERRLGHTFVEQGHALRDQYAAQYLPVLKEYNDAKTRGDQRAMAAITQKARDVVTKLKPVEDNAFKAYASAELAFQKGLDLAKGKDLESEAYIAFVNYDRGKDHHQRAKLQLAELFGKYQPVNDEERTTFEFAKNLFRQLGGILK
jgi:tetratricopeptide (TPR) repeat protein